VVLAGGRAARLGGADKASVELAGSTLLERALAATPAAAEVVVVGDEVPTSRPVTWTRETPPGGGPAAGLLAGVDAFTGPPDLVCVLAVDMPRVTVDTVARLSAAATDLDASGQSVDGALLVDRSGRRQPLAAVYHRSALEAVRPRDREDEAGLPVRVLVAGMRLAEVPTVGEEARDVDTWADLADLAGLSLPDPGE
jgi:molybdopterin-guanine dinucleotide biosynthesis protein A